MLNSLRKMLVKPRFGMRRCSGIWPPSKPRIMREPVRERCPLCPRVDVLPMPEPIPRPTRLRFSVAFFGARMFDKFMTVFLQSASSRLSRSWVLGVRSYDPRTETEHLFHKLDQMRNLGHHAANGLVVRTFNHLIESGESQPLDHALLFYRGANGGAHPLQVNLSAARIRFLRRHFVNLIPPVCSVLGAWYSLQFLRRLAAHGRYAFSALQLPQRVEGRFDHVMRVGGADRFRQDALDTRRSHDRSHRATRNHARALGSRLQQHLARTVTSEHEVGNSGQIGRAHV